MAQDYVPWFRSIWTDDDWRALTPAAQHMYLLIGSSPDRNSAGVLPMTVRKWSRLAAGWTVEEVIAALIELDERRFAVVDADTEEVLVRAFIRRTEVYRHIRMMMGALREVGEVESPRIRAVLRAELERLPELVVPPLTDRNRRMVDEAVEARKRLAELIGELPASAPHGISHGLPHPMADGMGQGMAGVGPHGMADSMGDGMGQGMATEYTVTPVHPMAHPMADGMPRASAGAGARTRVHADARGAGTGTSTSGSRTVLGGGVTEANAGARAVPDTPTPPLEEPSNDDVRDDGSAASPHTEPTHSPPAVTRANGMPPDRCRNHQGWADPPSCPRCKNARLAQEAWIAERDAKVQAARAAVAAEQAASKAAGRELVARCTYCDDRGVTPGGVVCTHDDRATMAPGRAAFLAEKDKLAARRGARSQTEPASTSQLSALATAFARHGNRDRDERLRWCNANLPADRKITSTSELTVAEASSLTDALTAIPPSVDLEPEPPVDDEIVEAVIHDEGCPGDDGADCDCGRDPETPVPPLNELLSPEEVLGDYRATVGPAEALGEPDEDPPEYLRDDGTDEGEDGVGVEPEDGRSYVYAGIPDDEPPF